MLLTPACAMDYDSQPETARQDGTDCEGSCLNGGATVHPRDTDNECYVQGLLSLPGRTAADPSLRDYQDASRWTIREEGVPRVSSPAFALMVKRDGEPVLRFSYRRPCVQSKRVRLSFDDGEATAIVELATQTEMVARVDVHPVSLMSPSETTWTNDYLRSQMQCLADIYAEECRVKVDVKNIRELNPPKLTDGFINLPVPLLTNPNADMRDVIDGVTGPILTLEWAWSHAAQWWARDSAVSGIPVMIVSQELPGEATMDEEWATYAYPWVQYASNAGSDELYWQDFSPWLRTDQGPIEPTSSWQITQAREDEALRFRGIAIANYTLLAFAHELGHMLGLPHTFNMLDLPETTDWNLMHPSAAILHRLEDPDSGHPIPFEPGTWTLQHCNAFRSTLELTGHQCLAIHHVMEERSDLPWSSD